MNDGNCYFLILTLEGMQEYDPSAFTDLFPILTHHKLTTILELKNQ
jgi:hypothetical protein